MQHLKCVASLAVGLLMLLTAQGCGRADPATETKPDTAGGGFPVTVDHIWGSTTVDSKPKTIVALGVTDADPVLALGSVPVALAGFDQYSDTLVGPWASDLLKGGQVEFIEDDAKPNIEEIAALQPDLIVAISAGIDKQTYTLLSELAPTLARPADTAAYTVPFDAATTMIAAALGRKARGRELVEEAKGAMAEAVKDNPSFRGKTATVVLPYEGKYGAYTPGDARGRFLADLGFSLPSELAALDDGSSYFIELSREQLDLADGDALIVLSDDASRDAVTSDPLLKGLEVAKRGAVIITEPDTRGALTYNTVLSIPYALERLVPQLRTALDS